MRGKNDDGKDALDPAAASAPHAAGESISRVSAGRNIEQTEQTWRVYLCTATETLSPEGESRYPPSVLNCTRQKYSKICK